MVKRQEVRERDIQGAEVSGGVAAADRAAARSRLPARQSREPEAALRRVLFAGAAVLVQSCRSLTCAACNRPAN